MHGSYAEARKIVFRGLTRAMPKSFHAVTPKLKTNRRTNESINHRCPCFARIRLRCIWFKRIPALYSYVAPGRIGRRVYASAVRQPLFLRRRPIANRRWRALPDFRATGAPRLDAAWAGDCE